MNSDWEDFKKTVNPLDKEKKKLRPQICDRATYKNLPIKNENIFIQEETSYSEKQVQDNEKNFDIEKNLLKKINRGKIKIEAKLDLHGYNLFESEEKVYNFVRKKYESNIRLILIITGKGKRLTVKEGWKGTGKLKENLPSWLRSGAVSDKIVWFDKAPANKGGDGAFLVYLKKKPKV